YLTLAHFSSNAAATPSIGRGANESDGLTPFGRDLIITLEEYDITVDVAHVNTPGVLDACEAADQPVMCTHTGVRGGHDISRNLTDEELDAIAETDGVVGIIFAPIFLAGRLLAPSEIVADHVEYVADRIGIRHVAIGSDYDGWIPTIPSDQRDCRDVGQVYGELERRGWYEAEIEAVAGGNALEVLSGGRG
ncbi:MAG: dipeptidase, partial [Bradymonadaceae bacterium]